MQLNPDKSKKVTEDNRTADHIYRRCDFGKGELKNATIIIWLSVLLFRGNSWRDCHMYFTGWQTVWPKKKLHILCIGRDKIGHDFRSFLKLFFEVQKDIKNARISSDTIVTEPISCPVGTRLVLYSFLGIIDSVNNIIHFLTRIFCVLLKWVSYSSFSAFTNSFLSFFFQESILCPE